VQIFGTLLWNSKIPLIGHNHWIGAYAENVPASGLMYYLNPLRGPSDWIPSLVVHKFQIMGEIPPHTWQIILHLFTDATVLIVGGIIFAIFWIEVSNMNAEAVANQIHSSGLQIPGFRRSPTMLKKRLENYIPQITVLGGATIGALTLFASLFGLIGGVTGTGMLLAVGIAYKLYEDMASQQMMEMYPTMRRFLGTS
jgi:preprotein translocase subunit SecY